MARPAVSVIVPFKGSPGEAAALVATLRGLELGPDDELLVVDNCPRPTVAGVPGVDVVRADRLASSYYARNAGAGRAANDWLLFLDSDVVPPATLLDDFFSEPIPERCGIVAGEVDGAPGQQALTARHARSRNHLGVEANLLHHGPHPAAGTANLMVRRDLWRRLDGFAEVRSGADLELCWRAQDAGWGFVLNRAARVQHLHAEGLGPTLRKARRYGAGQAWSNRRYPGSAPPPPVLRQVARAFAGIVVWTVSLRFERAAFKALDGASALAFAHGYHLGDNQPPRLES